jgi:WD40 repeat protein
MCASDHGNIGIWSVDSGQRLSFVGHELTSGAKSASLSADGRLVLAACRDKAVRLWDLDRSCCQWTLRGHRDRPQYAWLSPDGGLAASADGESVLLWDLGTGQQVRKIAHGSAHHIAPSVCLSRDGQLVLCAGYHAPPVRVWQVATGELVQAFGGPREEHRAVARFSPDGRFVLAGGTDGAVRVWEVGSGRSVHVLDGHRKDVWDMSVTPDARYALSGSADGTMRLWELDWELAAPGGSAGERGPAEGGMLPATT